MYIKGNNSFHQHSVLQHVTAPDSDSGWHLLLKSYISKSRGLCKVFSQMILSQAAVENLIMSATFHGCHTHLWESPSVLNQALSRGEYEIKSLQVWRGLFLPFCSSQDTAPPHKTCLFSPLLMKSFCSPCYWNPWLFMSRCCFRYSGTREYPKHYSIAAFVTRVKVKIIDLQFEIVIHHEHASVSDSYQVEFSHIGD